MNGRDEITYAFFADVPNFLQVTRNDLRRRRGLTNYQFFRQEKKTFLLIYPKTSNYRKIMVRTEFMAMWLFILL